MAPVARAAVLADLQRLAGVDVPPPRPDFLAELEARLFGDTDLAFDPGTDEEFDERPRLLGGVPRPMALAAVALVVVLLGIAVGTRVGPSSHVSTFQPANERSGHGDGGQGDTSSQDNPAAGASGDRRPVARLEGPSGGQQPAVPYYPDSAGQASAGVDTHSPSTPTAPAPAAHSSGRFQLTASGSPAQVMLAWDKYGGPDFAAYLVLRANAPDDAAYPYEGTSTLMMRRLENRDDISYNETPKVGTTPHYMVVVVDAAGRELARSNQVEPYALPTDVGVGLNMAGVDLQAVVPGVAKS